MTSASIFPLYKEQRGVSNRTLDNIRKTISSFFGWLNDEGHIGRNPARALKQIKYPHVVRKPFSPVEREKLKNACEFCGIWHCQIFVCIRTASFGSGVFGHRQY